jgi:hypothetical protein
MKSQKRSFCFLEKSFSGRDNQPAADDNEDYARPSENGNCFLQKNEGQAGGDKVTERNQRIGKADVKLAQNNQPKNKGNSIKGYAQQDKGIAYGGNSLIEKGGVFLKNIAHLVHAGLHADLAEGCQKNVNANQDQRQHQFPILEGHSNLIELIVF